MKPLLLAAIALTLTACAAEIRRVTAPLPDITENVRSRYATIEVLDVSLPTYASGEQIFTGDVAGILTGSPDLIWADDPTRATTLGLARALTQITGSRVAPEPWPFDAYPGARVDVRVEDMRAMGGTFIMSGQYFVAPLDGGGPGTARLFSVSSPLPAEAGPSDFARARSATITQLALQIAREGLR